jgi:3-oxoacyl-[acyl-carrier protein] reductase
VQGIPLVDLSLEDFTFPITAWTRTLFLTARAAARRMVKQGSGVIVTPSAPAGLATPPLVGGFEAAGAAVQGLFRTSDSFDMTA